MNLEQIKNDYADKCGFTNKTFIESLQGWDNEYQVNDYIDGLLEVVQKECLKRASENVTTVHHKECKKEDIIKAIHYTKHSITNENNIIK